MSLTTIDYALLSLEAYDPALYQVGATVGAATVIAKSDLPDGFGALEFSVNGQVVVAFRGTDNGGDVFNGWPTAVGITSQQAIDAVDFITPLMSDGSINLTFTGQSLGGGLAGLMSALYGYSSYVVDNSPYELTAQNIISEVNSYLASPDSGSDPDGSLYNTAFSLNPGKTLPVAAYVGNVEGEAVAGEALELSRSLQSWTPTALTTGIDNALLNQAVANAINAGDLYGLLGLLGLADFDANAIGLHMPALAPIYQYGDALSDLSWKYDGDQFYLSLFNVNLQTDFSVGGQLGGLVPLKLQGAIALSILSPGDPLSAGSAGPNGDTGIVSLFNGLNQIGKLLALPTASEVLKAVKQGFTDVAVGYAYDLALNAASDNKYDTGTLRLSTAENIITADLSQNDWLVGPNVATDVPGNDTLLTPVMNAIEANTSDSEDVSSAITELYGASIDEGDITDVSVAGTDAAFLDALTYSGNDGPERIAVFLGANGNETVELAKNENNIASTGSGKDILIGGDLDNILVGGNGEDTFVTGASTTIVIGGSGASTVDYSYANSAIIADLNNTNPLFNSPNNIYITHNGSGGVDTLFNVSNIIGSNFNDTISLSNDNGGDVVSRLVSVDGGGGLNTLDLTGFTNDVGMDFTWSAQGAVVADIRSGLIGDSYPILTNFEIVDLPGFQNILNINASYTGSGAADPLYINVGVASSMGAFNNGAGTINIDLGQNNAPVAIIGGAQNFTVNLVAPAGPGGLGVTARDPNAASGIVLIDSGLEGVTLNITGEVHLVLTNSLDYGQMDSYDLEALARTLVGDVPGPIVILAGEDIPEDKIYLDGQNILVGQASQQLALWVPANAANLPSDATAFQSTANPGSIAYEDVGAWTTTTNSDGTLTYTADRVQAINAQDASQVAPPGPGAASTLPVVGANTSPTINGDVQFGSAFPTVFGPAAVHLDEGKSGADTFVYGAGSGHLAISENYGSQANTSSVNFTGDTTASDITAVGDSAGDIILSDGVAGDALSIVGALDGSTGGFGVGNIVFDDGSTLTSAQIFALAEIPSATNTILYGSSGADQLDSAGIASSENGRGGADTFLYNRGYGTVTIEEDAGTAEVSNGVLELGSNISQTQISIQYDASGDILLSDGTLNDEVILAKMERGSEFGVSSIKFTDGSTLTLAQIIAAASPSVPTASSNEIDGTPGLANLIGTTGGDLLDSKGYVRHVQGLGGADTYVFNVGYGQLEIQADAGVQQATSSIIKVGGSLSASDLVATFDQSGDVTLTDGHSGDQVKLDGEVALGQWGLRQTGVATIFFQDGTSITQSQLIQEALTGSPSNTQLYGTWGAETFNGNGFASYEQGNGGADTFAYNAGQGSVEINEGAGDGVTTGAVLKFGAGITAADISVSVNSNFGLVVYDGILGDQITIDGMDQEVNYYNRDTGTFTPVRENGVSSVQLADGTIISAAQLINLAAIGSTYNTRLQGTSGADIFDSRGFASYAQGNGGADTFIYNMGYGLFEINAWSGVLGAVSSSVLQMGAGLTIANLTIRGDASGDLIISDGTAGDEITLDNMLSTDGSDSPAYGVASIEFSDGSSLTRGELIQTSLIASPSNRSLFGTEGADLLDSLGLASFIKGGGGEDSFVYNAGYGALEISEDAGEGGSQSSTLLLGTGITSGDLLVRGDEAGDLILTDGVSGDQITIDNMAVADISSSGGGPEAIGGLVSALSAQNSTSFEYGVASVQFADGTSLSAQQLLTMSLTASASNTSLYGTAGAEVMDSLGLANYEYGAGGADTFVYNVGYGALEIDEDAGWSSTSAILQLGPGITASDIIASVDVLDGDLTISAGASGDQIVLDAMGEGSEYGVQQIDFSDGSVMTASDLIAIATPVAPPGLLVEGAGPDYVDTQGQYTEVDDSGGGDTFVYNVNYGPLAIWEFDQSPLPANKLVFGAGITPSDVTLSIWSDGNSGDQGVTFTVNNGADSVSLPWMIESPASGVQEVDFSDGTVWTNAQILSQVGSGTLNLSTWWFIGAFSFDNAALGSYAISTINIIDDGDYDWSVTAGGASNTDIVISDSSGNSIDFVNALTEGSTPTVQFAYGGNWTYQSMLLTIDTAAIFNTSLYGDFTANTLDSAGIAHFEQGNGGEDTYVFNAGYGAVTINNTAATDAGSHGEIAFGAGIAPSNLWLDQSGNDLAIDVLGSNDQIIVHDWFSVDPSAKIAEVVSGNNQTLASSDVSGLVQAMATFESNYMSSHGVAFLPSQAATAIADTGVLTAVSAAWH